MKQLVSYNELERRWKEVRAAMGGKGLDWIICESTSSRLGGLVRWFTGRTHIYHNIVAFPIEGDLYYVSHGDHTHHKPVDSQGIRHLVKPYVQTLYVNTGAELLKDTLKRSNPKKIGLVGYARISTATYMAFKKSMPDVEFVDATDMVDEIKAVKSEEELTYMRRTVEMHDEVWEDVVCKSVNPGKTPSDIIREAVSAMMEKGSVAWWYRANASPPDEPCAYFGPTDRVIRDGDVFAMLMEFSGPEGYFSEIMRNICLGEIPRDLESAFEDVKEAQKRMARKTVPGADPSSILKESDIFMEEKGYPIETRLGGHSQGLDLVERPAFSPLGEPIKLRPNMVVSLHPTVHTSKAWGIIADNFLVTETGGKRLQKTPQELFVV